MKIISLNTWAGVLLEPLLAFVMGNSDVDVFCFQEIYSNAETEAERHPQLDFKLDLFERLRDSLRETHSGYFRPCYMDYYGQAMFVRNGVQVEEEGNILIYENSNPRGRGRHSRNLQYIRTSIRGRPIFIGNIHGLWDGVSKTDTPERLEQSRRVRAFVNSRDEEKVIVGDFNLNPDTKSMAILEQGMRNLVKEFGVSSTRTRYYEKQGKYADYALISPEIRVVTFRVLADEVSDHAPLFLEIA